MRTRHVAGLVLALAPILAAGGEGVPADGELLARHLGQARVLKPSSVQPGSDANLDKLKAEIAAKEQAWQAKGERELRAPDLLQGLPAATLEEARAVAADDGRTRTRIKAGVTLDFLLALVAARNPQTQTAYQNWRASTRRFEQAAYLEELVAQFRAFVRELDTLVGPQSHKEMPGKTFAFPSALALKGQIVDAETGLTWLAYQQALRRALNDAARAAFEIQYLAQAATVTRENRALFAQIVESTRAQFEYMLVSQADLLKAQSELVMLDNRLITLERQRVNVLAQIGALLGLAPDVEWGALTTPDLPDPGWSLEQALQLTRADSQELKTARAEVELMRLILRMAETEVLPRASVGYSQFAPSSGAEGGPTRSMMAAFPEKQTVTAELAPFGVNAAYLDELRVRVTQAETSLAAMTAEAELKTKSAHFQGDKARREQKTLAESSVPKSRQAFDTLQARYANNAAPFIEYLDAGRSHLDASLNLEEARMQRNQALVDLLDATGRTPAGARPAEVK